MIYFKKIIKFVKDCFFFLISKNIIFYILVSRKNNYFQGYNQEKNIFLGNKIGILIQGPIVKNFTIDTAKIYKKLYKNQEVVISTDTKLSQIEIEDLKISKVIYINYPPLKKNLNNLLSQSFGVSQGIEYLKKKNIKYVLKKS